MKKFLFYLSYVARTIGLLIFFIIFYCVILSIKMEALDYFKDYNLGDLDKESQSSSEEDIDNNTDWSIVTPEDIQKDNIVMYQVVHDGIIYDIPQDYQTYLWSKCIEYNITSKYRLLLAQIYTESRFEASAISKTNDYGLMQINIMNHEWLKKTLNIKDFLDPYDNIDAGVYLMQSYFKKYNDHKALMCYNLGETGMKNSGLSQSSYSITVISNMEKIQPITN